MMNGYDLLGCNSDDSENSVESLVNYSSGLLRSLFTAFHIPKYKLLYEHDDKAIQEYS